MVRNCAKRGDGFNVDEFCPADGRFLHKFIFEPKVFIATVYKDEIQGVAVCGFSTLPKGPWFSVCCVFHREQPRCHGMVDKTRFLSNRLYTTLWLLGYQGSLTLCC